MLSIWSHLKLQLKLELLFNKLNSEAYPSGAPTILKYSTRLGHKYSTRVDVTDIYKPLCFLCLGINYVCKKFYDTAVNFKHARVE